MTSVLILGGAGFFGRWLVTHLVENFLVDEIRVLDKVIPECAMLSKRCQRAFKEVEFQQCNLIIPGE
jgi:nucleoside-diphosphate-sugar epimerase